MTAIVTISVEELDQRIYRAVQRALATKQAKWVPAETAMELLNCKRSKLQLLVKQGHIRKSGGNGNRTIKTYLLEDIENYHNKNQ